MRTSATITAILAITIVPVSLRAADDFSALLADLSFGDAPAMIEAPSGDALSVAEEKTAEALQPVPTGIMMPEMIETTPTEMLEAAKEVVEEAAQSPQVALQDPIPTTKDSKNPVDMEAAFALQDPPQIQAETPAQAVGHLLDSGCSDQHCGSCGHGGSHGHHIVCRPRTKVQLPSSTLYQYFRSNVCHTNVWDGYQQKCCKSLMHVHGNCDCFHQKGGCAGGANCDAGCDSGCCR